MNVCICVNERGKSDIFTVCRSVFCGAEDGVDNDVERRVINTSTYEIRKKFVAAWRTIKEVSANPHPAYFQASRWCLMAFVSGCAT